MPNLTTKGLAYQNATIYICNPNLTASQLRNVNFVVASYQGSDNTIPAKYKLSDTNYIIFVDPTLFYENESLSFNATTGGVYFTNLTFYAQKISVKSSIAYGGGSPSLSQLSANNKIYISASYGHGGNDPIVWTNTGADMITPQVIDVCSTYICTSVGNWWDLYNATTETQFQGLGIGTYTTSISLALPFNATATIVNYFTTKYTQSAIQPV